MACNYFRVPDKELLSLEKLLKQETKSPASIQDFDTYLATTQIGEYLRFWLWHDGYKKMFEKLSVQERMKVECREWTKEDRHRDIQHGAVLRKMEEQRRLKALSPPTSPRASTSFRKPARAAKPLNLELVSPFLSLYAADMIEPFETAGMVLDYVAGEMMNTPVINRTSVREELRQGLRFFIGGKKGEDDVPYMLNLSHDERYSINRGTLRNIHPTVFQPAVDESEKQMLLVFPAFAHSALVNSSAARQVVSYYIAAGFFFVGLVFVLLAILSHLHPALRALVVLPWTLAVLTAFCARAGTCPLLCLRGKYLRKAYDPKTHRQGEDLEMSSGGGRRVVSDWKKKYEEKRFWWRVVRVEGEVQDEVVRDEHARRMMLGGFIGGGISIAVAFGLYFVPAGEYF